MCIMDTSATVYSEGGGQGSGEYSAIGASENPNSPTQQAEHDDYGMVSDAYAAKGAESSDRSATHNVSDERLADCAPRDPNEMNGPCVMMVSRQLSKLNERLVSEGLTEAQAKQTKEMISLVEKLETLMKCWSTV